MEHNRVAPRSAAARKVLGAYPAASAHPRHSRNRYHLPAAALGRHIRGGGRYPFGPLTITVPSLTGEHVARGTFRCRNVTHGENNTDLFGGTVEWATVADRRRIIHYLYVHTEFADPLPADASAR